MKVGDKVVWESQSGGFTKRKEGEITEIVPAGQMPTVNIPGSWNPITKRRLCGSRKGESYVVKANGKNYWPLVKNLGKA